MLGKIGFTTTIPVELLFAGGVTPVDLNNIFISSPNSESFIQEAEMVGFPRNTCAWIKGIYSSVIHNCDINAIVGVVEGDCSNTRALIEVLALKGIKNISFSYPSDRSYNKLDFEIKKLMDYFGVSLHKCIQAKKELDLIRERVKYLDYLTWKESKATGFENHLWQVSCSDFNGDYKVFSKELNAKISEIENRDKKEYCVRLGFVGVPPINTDLFDFAETHDAKIIFNEVQRQFTMVHGIGNSDITDVYTKYTYPYGINARIDDINREINIRGIHGIIHYTQAFCFRGIEDIILRNKLDVPVLTLEGDRPGKLDARSQLRIEAFIDMLK